jgi:hypothetical protein
MILIPLSIEKYILSAGSVPPLSRLTSCTHTKCNLYFDSSFAAVMSEPALYRLLIFHVWGPLWHFITSIFFYGEELLAPRPALKLEDYHLLAVCNCLFSIFAATLYIWSPSPLSATWGHAVLWWQGTHLTWIYPRHHFQITWPPPLPHCLSRFTVHLRIAIYWLDWIPSHNSITIFVILDCIFKL